MCFVNEVHDLYMTLNLATESMVVTLHYDVTYMSSSQA